MPWPLQSQCNSFYGDPRGRGGAEASPSWRKANLTTFSPPFKMAMGSIKITKIPVHKKCADAFAQWLEAVWGNAGKDPKTIALWGMDVFSGSFCYRPMRGLSALSMHAYGCAVDFDAPRNALGARKPNLAKYHNEIIAPFIKLGGVWGGGWTRPDGMHFQCARVG